jgi:bacteriorhodopsin
LSIDVSCSPQCFAFVYIIFKLFVSGRATAAAKGEKVVHLFTSITIFAMVVWTVCASSIPHPTAVSYPLTRGPSSDPIIFVLAEGPKKISPDTEVIAYAVLDILAKPVFG